MIEGILDTDIIFDDLINHFDHHWKKTKIVKKTFTGFTIFSKHFSNFQSCFLTDYTNPFGFDSPPSIEWQEGNIGRKCYTFSPFLFQIAGSTYVSCKRFIMGWNLVRMSSTIILMIQLLHENFMELLVKDKHIAGKKMARYGLKMTINLLLHFGSLPNLHRASGYI